MKSGSTSYSVVFARDCSFHGERFRKGDVLSLPEVEGLAATGLELVTAIECIEFSLDMYLPDDYDRRDGSPFEVSPAPPADALRAVRRYFELMYPGTMFSWMGEEETRDAA